MEEPQQRRKHVVSVELSPEKLKSLREPYKSALLAKVINKKIKIDQFHNRLHRIWSLEGAIQISELPNGFFVVVFSHDHECLKALNGGPWKIAGHCITLQPYVYNFNFREARLPITRIWIRLLGFPVELYDVEVFQLIAKAMKATFVCIEDHVKKKFARLCIEVDLNEPLPSFVEICGLMQPIEYEGLGFICSICRRVEHLKDLISEGCDPCCHRGDKSENRGVAVTQIQGSGIINDDLSADDASRSSDLIKEALFKYLGEGISVSSSSSELNGVPPHDFLGEGKKWQFEGKMPMVEASLDMSIEKAATKLINTQNASQQRARTHQLNPKTQPFRPNKMKGVAVTQFQGSGTLNMKNLQLDEGTSSSSLSEINVQSLDPLKVGKNLHGKSKMPMVEENFDMAGLWRNNKMSHPCWEQTGLVRSHKCSSSSVVDKDEPSTSARGQDPKESYTLLQANSSKLNRDPEKPFQKAATNLAISAPSPNTQNDSRQPAKAQQLNPRAEPFRSSKSQQFSILYELNASNKKEGNKCEIPCF